MANMNDVAKLAGVSRGTVSNYINGIKLKETSRQKVEAAIKELGYIPNIPARDLKRNRSNLVAFIIPTTHSPFFAELVYEMQQALNRAGFKMLLCISNHQIAEELEYIQMAKEQKVAGIITISYSDLPMEQLTGVPIVSIEKKLSDCIPCVSSQNSVGGSLAAEMLLKKGAKNLLLLTRTTDKSVFNYGQRMQGFIRVCKEKGISYQVFDSSLHETDYYQALEAFLLKEFGKKSPVDGIFAVNDQYADYSCRILQSLGYQIPNDIQMIGFDGGKMYPEQQQVISSIRQPVFEIVKHCIEQLQVILQKSSEGQKDMIFLPVYFVEGLTTKKIEKSLDS